MFNFFKQNKKLVNSLFSEFPASERISKIVENLIFPNLEKLGFKFSKSSLEISRKVGDFKQSIFFRKSRQNSGEVFQQFEIIFIVECTSYKKWFEKEYLEKFPNDYRINNCTFWANHEAIPNWEDSLYSAGWYDLVVRDNSEIVAEINQKLSSVAIPYMNQFSDFETAIDAILSRNLFTKTGMILDFCQMNNLPLKALEIKKWYQEKVLDANIKLNEDVVFENEKRLEKVGSWN